MGKFVKGEVISILFPFSDLSDKKRRPALVISDAMGDDVILCQITASHRDKHSVELTSGDFAHGSLPHGSFIRPNKIFTADENTILAKKGTIKSVKYNQVIETIVNIIS